MENTVWIVRGSTGAWDSHANVIIGIASTKWKAEMMRETAIHQNNLARYLYTQEQKNAFDIEVEKLEDANVDYINWPNEVLSYDRWKLTDWLNEQVEIIECQIDKPLMR